MAETFECPKSNIINEMNKHNIKNYEFYTAIKPCLNAMATNPSQDTISNLVNYSKSI